MLNKIWGGLTKLLLISALVLFCSQNALASFTYKNTAVGQGTADSAAATISGTTVTSGDLVVITASWVNDGVTATISDTSSTFVSTTAFADHFGSQIWHQQFYTLAATATGTPTYTLTATGSAYPFLVVQVWTPSAAVTFDQTATFDTFSSSIDTGNITTTGADELVVVGASIFANPTVSNWQIGGSSASTNVIDYLHPVAGDRRIDQWYLATNGTVAGTASLDSSLIWLTRIVSFKIGSGSRNAGDLMSMGIGK